MDNNNCPIVKIPLYHIAIHTYKNDGIVLVKNC